MLHSEYAEIFGWTKAEPEYFESDEVRDFVASVLMYNYKQNSKREDRGLGVRIKRVGRALKAMKIRKTIKEGFAKVFKKESSE